MSERAVGWRARTWVVGGVFAVSCAAGVADRHVAEGQPTPPQAAPVEAPRSTYWIRRISRHTGARCGNETCSTGGQTLCASMTFEEHAVEIDASPFVRDRTVVRLHGRRTPEGWLVGAISLSLHGPGVGRRVELTGSCRATLATPTEAFRDRAQCEATPSAFSATCVGPTCAGDLRTRDDALAGSAWSFDERSARPLVVPGCERTIAELDARAHLVVNADYADVERTFRRFRRVVTRGGVLYERDAVGCATVSARPGRDGYTVLFSRQHETDEIEIEDRARYRFEPVRGEAVLVERGTSRLRAGVPFGGSGSTSTNPVGMYFGAGLVLVGDRAFLTTRRDCPPARSHR